jgi:hypothetical protein
MSSPCRLSCSSPSANLLGGGPGHRCRVSTKHAAREIREAAGQRMAGSAWRAAHGRAVHDGQRMAGRAWRAVQTGPWIEATHSRVCASLIGTSSCARSRTQRRAMGPTSLRGLNAFAVTTSQSNAHSRLSSFTFSVTRPGPARSRHMRGKVYQRARAGGARVSGM